MTSTGFQPIPTITMSDASGAPLADDANVSPATDEPDTAETLDELAARHRREIKSLEGEKRAALKNAKGKGKKAKAAIKEVEFKYDGMERDLKARQRQEVAALSIGGAGVESDGVPTDGLDLDDNQQQSVDKSVSFDASATQQQTQDEQRQTEQQLAEAKRMKSLEKKLKKKNAQKQKEIDREKRIEQENATAGPSPRILEIEAMTRKYLTPNNLRIQEVQADGNCLYRAVAAQALRLGIRSDQSDDAEGYKKMRELCAAVLMEGREEYEPFAELDHDLHHPASTYEEYVDHVRSTSTWGGQLELRALSHGLQCPIVVFSAEAPPLTMGEEYNSGSDNDCSGWEKKKAILVSFHRYYYALGEHYNSVVPLELGSGSL